MHAFRLSALRLRRRPSGSAAAPSAASGTRSSRRRWRRRKPAGAVTLDRQAAAHRRRRGRSRAAHARPASASSTACSAAAWSPARWCCSAAIPASASRRCCCRRSTGWRAPARRVLYVSGEESVQQTALRAGRLGVRTPDAARAGRDRSSSASSIEADGDASRRCSPSTRCRRCTRRRSSRSRARSARCARRRAGCSPSPRPRACRWSSSATSPRTARSPGPRRSSTWSTACSTSKASARTTTASCARPRTASARPTRSASSRCAPKGWARCTIRRRCSWPSGRSARPARWWSASVEGSRPILVEIQALVAHAAGMPRRTALGIDPNRVSLLLAVIERRAGIDVLGQDVFVNVAGGVRLSRAGERPRRAGGGGVVGARPAGRSAHAVLRRGRAGRRGARRRRASSCGWPRRKKLGFRRCVLPELSRTQLHGRPELELVGVRDVGAAFEALLG